MSHPIMDREELTKQGEYFKQWVEPLDQKLFRQIDALITSHYELHGVLDNLVKNIMRVAWYDEPLGAIDGEISQAHPTNDGQYDRFTLALEVVNARHSKYALVDVVNYLLSRLSPEALADVRQKVDKTL